MAAAGVHRGSAPAVLSSQGHHAPAETISPHESTFLSQHQYVSLTDAIRRDHAAFRDVMRSIEAAAFLSPCERLGAVFDLVRLVTQHSMAEEVVLYPLARSVLGPSATDIDLEFHRALRNDLSALSWCGALDPSLDDKLARCWSNLDEHMREEENDLLSKLERTTTPERLAAAGRAFAAAKMLAPTRPHVSAPMTPPLNLIASALAAPLDWLADMWRFRIAPPLA